MPELHEHGGNEPQRMATDTGKPTVEMRLKGSAVTREDAEDAAGHLVDALDAVADHMGLPTGLWSRTTVQIACDSCDARRPWDDEGHGWVRTANGLDYCPACIVTKPGA